MPDPGKFFGKDWVYGSPEAREQFRGMASPDLWEILGRYKSGQSTDWPSSSYDYLLKTERPEEDAGYVAWYLDNMKDLMGAGKDKAAVPPTPPQVATPFPSTVGETNPLLIELLNQGK